MVKEATWLLIIGKIKGKRYTMTFTTSLWDPYYVEKLNNITMKKILKMVRRQQCVITH